MSRGLVLYYVLIIIKDDNSCMRWMLDLTFF